MLTDFTHRILIGYTSAIIYSYIISVLLLSMQHTCIHASDVRMRYVLGISVLVWFNLHLSQGVLEHNPGATQEERISDGDQSHGSQEDAICTMKTWLDVLQCRKDLTPLVKNGFPWARANMSELQNQIQQNHRRNLADPLDPINYVCEVFGDFLKCVDQHAIPSECMVSGDASGFVDQITFQFVCDIQPRSIDLLHSLQCLTQSRVLDLLVLYLADRSGTHIDDMAQGNVNALFTLLMKGNIQFMKFFIEPFPMDLLVSTGLISFQKA